MSAELDLIIDNVDNYKRLKNVFFLDADRISLLKCLSDNRFSSCLIRNTTTESLTTINLSFLNQKLIVDSRCEIIIDQPIKLLQIHDARQIEANAKLAGFSDFKIEEQKLVEPETDINFSTLILTFVKTNNVVACDFEDYHVKPYRVIQSQKK